MPTTAKRPPTRKKAAATVPEDWTPSQVVAHAIDPLQRPAPSVNRIMDAGLGEAGGLRAITLFQESLGVHDDPMRNPVNAIAAGRLLDAEPA